MAYFATYTIIRNDPSKADNAIKIVLWYLPILIEILSHFWANSNRMPGRVRYSFETIAARASSSFVITLGGGMCSHNQTDATLTSCRIGQDHEYVPIYRWQCIHRWQSFQFDNQCNDDIYRSVYSLFWNDTKVALGWTEAGT
jgi:hypothetical protein